MDRKAFGKEVERCRVASGLNQEQFRAVFGVSQQTVSNWENGSIPQPGNLNKLCKMAGLDVDQIARLRAKRKKTLAAVSQNHLGLPESPPDNHQKHAGTLCHLPHITNKHQAQITKWIATQDEPNILWGELKSFLRRQEPAFAEFLKKSESENISNG